MAYVPLANDLNDLQTMIDPDALDMKLAHAASYREDTPGDDEMMEVYKRHAYNDHDTLIEMGGRPTRAVLAEPAWEAIYEKDQIRIVDNHGALECTLAPDENLTLHHWSEECSRFEEELDRWKEFQDYQRKNEHHPLLKISFDPENTDQRLVKILVRLNEWREFQHYQQVNVGLATMLTWKITRAIGKIVREEAMTDEATPSPEISYKIAPCLRKLFPRQQGLETSEMLLKWIESQIPEILSEACASLESAYPLQRHLDMKLEQQANAFYQELKILEAGPDLAVQVPRESAGFSQKICHWGSEISRLMQELWEWKIFLKWRRMQPSVSKTANLEEQVSSGRSSDLQIWVDYVAYRRFQLDRTRNWVACWQRLMKERENELETASKDLGLIFLQNSIAKAREYVERFQQDIHTAESQVRLAEQQLAELSSQQSSLATVQVTNQTTGHPRLPPSPPKSDSTESIFRYRQLVTVADVVVPDRGIVNDEFQMSAAPDSSYQQELVGEGRGADSTDTHMSDAGDTSMIDVKDTIHTSSRPASDRSCPASETDSKGRNTSATKKSPLPFYQVPTSRKTRSAAKLHSDRILKNMRKKQAKKGMTFTEQQSLTLLNAASTSCPPTGPISLRKSERLKQKAEAS